MWREILEKRDSMPENGVVIGIYGTGLGGRMVFRALQRLGIPVGFFLDGDARKQGSYCCGKKIIDLDDAGLNAYIWIAADPAYKIHERLECRNMRWDYVDPAYIYLYSEGYDSIKIRSIFQEHKNSICRVYDMLEDEMSKKVFQSILMHRLEHDLSRIQDIYDENQYFGNDVIPYISGNVVDCGAYTGDTLRRFLGQLSEGGKMDSHYFAFEAGRHNSEAILSFCKDCGYENIKVYNIVVSDKKKQLYFGNGGTEEDGTGRAADAGHSGMVKVEGNSIDNVLGEMRVDMITMDIEGDEISALHGAERCIHAWRPKLAVSAYHDIYHLWKVPLLIKELEPDYHIFYRHHRWNMHDTVCYAVK